MSDAAALSSEIEAVVSAQAGLPAQITSARPLAGGASMETWALDLRVGDVVYELVLRRDMATNMFDDALTRAQEFALLALAHAGGVLAPRPRWLHTDTARAWFLMARLPGESVGRRIVRRPELAAARAKLAAQMGEQLARIHALRIPAEDPPVRVPAASENPVSAALALVRTVVDRLAIGNPVWEFALRWLSRNAPPATDRRVLVHADFRIGNLLVTIDGLAGVLDWEFAHVGDPMEDLAWPLVRDWRFENDALHVGGVGTLDDYLGAYERASGRSVNRRALAWWEMLGNLRWAVFCHSQAQRHLSGRDRSVELASLGRKAAEMEWELLRMIREAAVAS